MESTVYRVIVINQHKVIVSLDGTLNDTLLQAVKGDISGINYDDSNPSRISLQG